MKAMLQQLLDGQDLTEAQATQLLDALVEGHTDPALAGALLVALRQKGERPAEVLGLVRGLLARAVRPKLPRDQPLVDVVGTGGDGSDSVNLSTGAALLSAAMGHRVVKHGNRAVSSRCGSADVLSALGLDLGHPAHAAHRAQARLDAHGFTFLFAPHHHPAMGAVAPIRRALGIRTTFNLLGPLVNPARPELMLVGAFSPEAARLMAETLAQLDVQRAFVVHGAPGWDEPTPVGPFLQLEVRPGTVLESTVDPAEHGVPRCRPEELRGGDAPFNARLIRAALGGRPGPIQDALTLGAGLVAQLSGAAEDLAEGVHLARHCIATGRASLFMSRLAEPAEGAREVAHG